MAKTIYQFYQIYQIMLFTAQQSIIIIIIIIIKPKRRIQLTQCSIFFLVNCQFIFHFSGQLNSVEGAKREQLPTNKERGVHSRFRRAL